MRSDPTTEARPPSRRLLLWGRFWGWIAVKLRASRVPGKWRLNEALRRFYPRGELAWPTAYGFSLWIQPRDGYHRTIFETGTYEPGTLALISAVVSEGDTVVDCGANIGLMTCHASRCVGAGGRVFAFEPHPKTFKTLKRNLHLCEAKNVTAIALGVGNQSETRAIYDRIDVNVGASSVVAGGNGVVAGEIEMDRLADVLGREWAGPVRLIKLDVEGSELPALEGAQELLQNESAPILIIESDLEMSREIGSMEDIFDLVLGHEQYRAYRLRDTKWGQSACLVEVSGPTQVPQHDNVIFLPRSAAVPRHLFG